MATFFRLQLTTAVHFEMRVAPLRDELKLQGEENTNCAVQQEERANRGNQTEYLYELELAQPLPIFDLSKTLVSKLLPSTTHTRLCLVMHNFLNSFLVRLFRVSLLCFGCLLFVPVKFILPGVPFMVAAIVLPPVIFVTFFSLDVLVLLAYHYEFWFITVLNTLNWVGLGVIFGDIRALSCIGLWLSSQSVVFIDSNYPIFPTAVKSIIISGPFLILLVVCCSYNLVADANYPAIDIGKLTLQARQVVIFASSTLSLFVVKKAYTKNHLLCIRLRDRQDDPESAQGLHTIPCVELHARVRLSHRGVKRSIGQTQFGASTMRNLLALAPRTTTPVVDVILNVQKLKLAPHDPFFVDARNVVLPVMGLSATAVVWMMILYHHNRNSMYHLERIVAVVAAASSLVFMFVAFSLAQRDLLRLVVWNFDVLFSTFQGTALAVFLLDLLSWQTSPSLAIFAWWLWFHCLLVLDALTPSLTCQLNIRKHFGLAAVIVMLCVAAGCALELISAGDDGVFSSRLLWSVRLSGADFDLHMSTLAVQRTITIVGWFPRLLVELATGSPDQLLFIHRQVEFFSPYATFSDAAPGTAVASRNRKCWLRRSKVATPATNDTIDSSK